MRWQMARDLTRDDSWCPLRATSHDEPEKPLLNENLHGQLLVLVMFGTDKASGSTCSGTIEIESSHTKTVARLS